MFLSRALPGRTLHLGEKDSAVQALEKAFAEREPMAWLNVDPEWERSDPRFQDLVRRVGLPVNAVAGAIPHLIAPALFEAKPPRRASDSVLRKRGSKR